MLKVENVFFEFHSIDDGKYSLSFAQISKFRMDRQSTLVKKRKVGDFEVTIKENLLEITTIDGDCHKGYVSNNLDLAIHLGFQPSTVNPLQPIIDILKEREPEEKKVAEKEKSAKKKTSKKVATKKAA